MILNISQVEPGGGEPDTAAVTLSRPGGAAFDFAFLRRDETIQLMRDLAATLDQPARTSAVALLQQDLDEFHGDRMLSALGVPKTIPASTKS